MKIEEKVWPARSWYAKEMVAKLWYMDAVDEPEEKIGAQANSEVLQSLGELRAMPISKRYFAEPWYRAVHGDGCCCSWWYRW